MFLVLARNGDPKTWFSEAVNNHNVIKQSIAELEEILKKSNPP